MSQVRENMNGPGSADIDLPVTRSRSLPVAVNEHGLPVTAAALNSPTDDLPAADIDALARVERGDWTRSDASAGGAGRTRALNAALLVITALLFVPLVAGLVMLVNNLEPVPAVPTEQPPATSTHSPHGPARPQPPLVRAVAANGALGTLTIALPRNLPARGMPSCHNPLERRRPDGPRHAATVADLS